VGLPDEALAQNGESMPRTNAIAESESSGNLRRVALPSPDHEGAGRWWDGGRSATSPKRRAASTRTGTRSSTCCAGWSASRGSSRCEVADEKAPRGVREGAIKHAAAGSARKQAPARATKPLSGTDPRVHRRKATAVSRTLAATWGLPGGPSGEILGWPLTQSPVRLSFRLPSARHRAARTGENDEQRPPRQPSPERGRPPRGVAPGGHGSLKTRMTLEQICEQVL
jgi:hypothetical protein